MKELADTLLETKVHEIMDAQTDTACEGGSTVRNDYRERGPTAPSAASRSASPSFAQGHTSRRA